MIRLKWIILIEGGACSGNWKIDKFSYSYILDGTIWQTSRDHLIHGYVSHILNSKRIPRYLIPTDSAYRSITGTRESTSANKVAPQKRFRLIRNSLFEKSVDVPLHLCVCARARCNLSRCTYNCSLDLPSSCGWNVSKTCIAWLKSV